MAVRESVRIDLGKVDRLIEEQEAELEPKHRASIAYREIAERHVAGGVASSWQASPPHAIFIDRGDGSHIWDIDGNEYVDYHLGYGAMVVGHAHPAIVEAIQRQASRGTHFAQPTKHLDVIGENLAERFSLPLWRFCNSGTEATLEAARLMRAKTGRDLLIKIEGTYHGHHDSLMFSVIPDPDLMGPREYPFDEVKTGATLAYGGAVEAFGVVPDIVCLAKAIGGGTPCGAIGATEELFRLVVDGEYDMAGTFNGNPLTMAAMRATLTEVLTKDVYGTLNHLDGYLKERLSAVIERYRLPAYVTGGGAKGSVIYSPTPVREYRDSLAIDERITYLAWLFQQNGGVFKAPWSKQETWTLSVRHTDEDAQRYVDNLEAFAQAVTS